MSREWKAVSSSGWLGTAGYDNQHPDYLPACKEAGGWEDMKELADTMHKCGYMFGIHDQYRDFYKAAPSLMKIMPADYRMEVFRSTRDGREVHSHICVQHRHRIM